MRCDLPLHQRPPRFLPQGFVQGTRHVFLPPKQRRLHLDLSALLFGLAYERGLFTKPLEDLLHGDELFIATNKDVAEQAVFVAADTQGILFPC